MLCFFHNSFNYFNVWAYDPLGLNCKSFYRGMVESARACFHEAPTLNMKGVFHNKLTTGNKEVPRLVHSLLVPEKRPVETKSLASTVVCLSAILKDVEQVLPFLLNLVDAMKCHSVFGSADDWQRFDDIYC